MSYGAKLPEELVVDILHRLPAKALCRFKCVSKSWLTLISDPHFTKTHLNRNSNNIRERVILFSDYLYSVDCAEASNNDAVTATKLDFHPIKHPDEFEILGSCNGLLLVSDADCTKFLLNPSTREFRELPDFESPFSHYSDSGYTIYGLGYDSSADDYKVVTIDADDDYGDADDADDTDDDDAAAADDDDESCCTNIIVSVYSVKNDSWRRIQDVPHYHPFLRPSSLVLVNGFLHWFTFTSSGYLFVVAAFDVANEKFRDMQTPSALDHNNLLFYKLGVFGGCLCMLVSPNGNQTDVWVMKEYGVTESWTKFEIYAPNLHMMKPLCFLVGEEVLLEMKEKLVALNAKEKTSRDIVVCGIPAMFEAGTTYVESLVSPYYNCGYGIERNYEGIENLKSDQLDRSLELMIEAYIVGKAKRYKLDSTSSSRSIESSNSITDHFSLSDFLDCLKSIGLERPIYEKALEMFEDPYWREKFISMIDKRKSFCSGISDTQDGEHYQRYERRIEEMMREKMEQMEQMRLKMEQMREQMQQIRSLWAQNANNQSCPNASPSVPSTENLQGANCELLHYNGTGLVVATGEVVSLDPTIVVNDAPLSSDCWKVRVNYVFEPEVPLYRAHPSYFLLQRANGNSIAWPCKFIKINGPSG